MMKRIVNLSGGKDSTAMLLIMLENNIPFDEIVFIDTTKEFPQVYDHLEKLELYIGIPIKRIKIRWNYYFSHHITKKGKKGYSWPDIKNRWCTGLKIKAINSYSKDNHSYVGIASDESHRMVKNSKISYPLVERGMTEQDALKYCYDKGFDWDGYYEMFYRMGCWCCPLSDIGAMRNLYLHYPDLWKKLERMDDRTYRKFKKEYSVAQLTTKFYYEQKIGTLDFRI